MPPAQVERNIFEMTDRERKELGITTLPDNLLTAVEAMESDELICKVLGEHIAKNYCQAKRSEWAQYSRNVTEWELEQYLYRI